MYPNSLPSRALFHVADNHELILSDYNIAELRRVAHDKFAKAQADIDVLLSSMTYTLITAPLSPQKLISDPKDAPILNAAIIEDIDIIISGDKHFRSLELERPKVLTAAQYLESEVID
jgi:predicted nucleic acid-binding protein